MWGVLMSLPVRITVTAQVEAVTPKGDEDLLVEFLRAYRDSVQLVVDGIWGLSQVPSEKKLHKQYYSRLKSLGFRAHHVSEIYRRAKEVVKSAKKNNGSKPVLKKLTARIHTLDYKIDLDKKTLEIAVLRDKWVELKLEWYSYLDKYLDGSWKPGEILLSYRYGRILVYITFHKDMMFREPRTVMGVDLNFNNVTYTIIDLNSELISIGVIPFRDLSRALHLRKLAEDLQRKHPKNWRVLRGVQRVRRVAIYARVSSNTQRNDLERQVDALKLWVSKNFPNAEYIVVTDIANGLNEDRRGLRKLIEMAKRKEIQAVVIAYRDRLTRFGFEYLKTLFNTLGVDVYVVLQEEPKDYIQELVEDFVEIVTSFASRIYGKRSKRYKEVVSCIGEAVKDSN
jgi:predicted site-specific integrase-resolvase